MQICRKLAGYSYGQADILRKAMSKKNPQIMAQERQKFLYGSGLDDGCIGAIANGVPEDVANTIFDQMEAFALYAFNKSHAAAYALVAYQTAYLKTHYFADYMAALMTSVIGDTGKLAAYVEECRSAGVPVCPPDVNSGEWCFSSRDGKLYFGLLAIKGMGRGLIDRMMAERRNHGKFQGFVDFCRRMSALGMNKRALEGLIQAGALDHLGCNRRQMMLHYEQVMETVSGAQELGIEGQMSLFGDAELIADDLTIPAAEEYDPVQMLQMERNAAGMFISGHPLDSLAHLQSLLRCTALSGLEKAAEKQEMSVLCLLLGIRRVRTKKGEEMAFLSLEDATGTMEAVVFPKLYEISTGRLVQGQVIYIKGNISRKENRVSLICGSIRSYQDMPLLLRQRVLYIRLREAGGLDKLSDLCGKYSGETEIMLRLPDGRTVAKKPPLRISVSAESYQALCRLFGAENLVLYDRIGS